MMVHEDIRRIPPAARGTVAAIGNFDGVHRGHRALLREARALADREGAALSVLTFDPHPRRFFQPQAEPFLLTMPATKHRLLADSGVAHVFSARFDADFSALSAEDFIRSVLVHALGVRAVVVGDDFVFGHNRGGTVDTLRQAHAFVVHAAPQASHGAYGPYASTAIRNFLRQGRLDAASDCLGWSWYVESDVVHGDKRGRAMGYPTANQRVDDYVRLPYGVYAVKALVEGERAWRSGAANFGIRPMFRTPTPLLETHIFDFDQEIYGKILRVLPVRFLRPEMAFDDIDTLQRQIKDDCAAAQAVLESHQDL